MKTSLLSALHLAVLAATVGAGCTSTSISGPGRDDAVAFELRVTGGIAGADYAVRVDGVERRVDVSCVHLCPDPRPGSFGLSPEQWSDLVAEARRAGLPGLGDRDYGSTCCDFFQIDLEMRDGLRSARIQGDAGSLPPALVALSGRITALAHGSIPALVLPGAAPGSGPADPLQLGSVRVEGLVLVAGVTWSGGCRAHEIDLRFAAIWEESNPVQTPAWLTHDGRDDPCDALPSEVRRFDLRPLVEAYWTVYPGASAGDRIRVRLTAPGDPRVRTIDVFLPDVLQP